MSDRSDAASLSYLDGLLRMAVTRQGAPPDPVAGRVIVPLLGMAIGQGEGGLIAQFVTPEPGREATYEIRRPDPSDAETVVLSGDLNEVAAFRAAVRFSREGIGGVMMVGRTADGVERCSLRRTSDGVLEYLHPSAEVYAGPDAAVQRALHRWDDTIRRWSAQIDTPGTTDGPAAAPGLARNVPDLPRSDRPDRIPTAAEIADAIQSSLMQMTVDINLTEVESLIRRTIESTFGALGTSGPPVAPLAPAIADQIAVADQIATVVVDRMRDLLQLTSDTAAERAAPLVAGELGPLLRQPTGRQPTGRQPPLRQPTGRQPPAHPNRPDISEEIGALLSELAETQRQLLSAISAQVGIESRLVGAVEHLDLQVQELREYGRTSSGALQALNEQVAGLARRSEVAGERLAAAIGQELDTLADRMRHQLITGEAAAKRAAIDGAVPEAVSRLTSRVARTEVQFEKLLNRLNEVLASESKRPAR